VKRQPVAAGLEPGFQSCALLGVGIGARYIGDEQPAYGQPFLHVGEVVGDGSRHLPLGQQREEPKASIVVVVTGAGAGWKTARNDMSAVLDDVCHVIAPFPFDPQCYRGTDRRVHRFACCALSPTRRRLGSSSSR